MLLAGADPVHRLLSWCRMAVRLSIGDLMGDWLQAIAPRANELTGPDLRDNVVVPPTVARTGEGQSASVLSPTLRPLRHPGPCARDPSLSWLRSAGLSGSRRQAPG